MDSHLRETRAQFSSDSLSNLERIFSDISTGKFLSISVSGSSGEPITVISWWNASIFLYDEPWKDSRV